MKAKNSEPVDLFGLPVVEQPDRRGRKAYRRNAEVAKKIAVSRAMGATEEMIAALVGIDPKTLRKYYSRELEKAGDMVQALLDDAVFEAAIIEKRVGAQRLLQERLDKGRAAVPIAPTRGRAATAPAPVKPKAEPKLGKKEQALKDASTAHEGTTWGDVLKPH